MEVNVEAAPDPPAVKRTSSPPTTLFVDRNAYAPGDTLTLVMAAGDTLKYNLCGAWLYRQTAGVWEPVRERYVYLSPEQEREGTIVLCPKVAYVALPGDTARHATRLSTSLEPGRYRFRETVVPESAPWAEGRDGVRREVKDTLETAPFLITRRQ